MDEQSNTGFSPRTADTRTGDDLVAGLDAFTVALTVYVPPFTQSVSPATSFVKAVLGDNQAV